MKWKHHAKWKQNERTRQAVKKAASGEEVLKKINAETQRDFLGVAASDAPEFSAAEDVLSSEVVVDLTLPPLGGAGVIPTIVAEFPGNGKRRSGIPGNSREFPFPWKFPGIGYKCIIINSNISQV